ncbi:hypothetical protein Tco_0272614 [Tanacetum coccineum]
MVAYLKKSDETAEFHQIVDFLSTCSINYALTVSPTIYASYIEQFWNTATSKTINSVKQIHDIVDGKAVVISESSVRSDLLFDDEDGITCLTNDEIFENLWDMNNFQQNLLFKKNQAPGGEGSAIPPEPQPTPSTSQPQVAEPQIESLQLATPLTAEPLTEVSQAAVSQIVFHDAHIEQILPSPTTYQRKRKTHKRRRTKKDIVLPQTSVPLDHGADEAVHKEGVTGIDTGGSPRRQETMGGTPAQTRSERVLEQPSDLPLPEGHTFGSREGNMEHIFELTDDVPPTPHDSPLTGGYTPGSDEGRLKLDELITLCTKLSKQVLDLEKEKDAQAVKILNLKKRVKKLERKRKSSISHPRRRIYMQVETSSDDDLDEEDASKQGRRSDKIKPMFKDKGFDELNDVEVNADEQITTTGPSQVTIDPKDKGKGVLVEEESDPSVKIKRSDQGDLQVQSDAELAQLLHQEELAELERRQKERERQEKASMDAIYEEYDTIQANIDADTLFAAKLQQEEREQFTIEERAQFLVETIAAQRKFRAAQRAAEIRSKPPTKTQMRNLMMTYLKNMGGYKHSQLKGKTYEEIHRLYERQQKRDQDFIPMDSEKEAQKSSKRLKRVAESYTTQKSPKKPKVMKSAKDATEEKATEYEKEKEELRLSLKIIPNDDSEVNYEPLFRKFPIVSWEYKLLGTMEAKDIEVCKLTRVDGSSSFHGDIHAFFRRLDRQDLNDIYRLVQERFQDHPLEGHDLLLLGDLRMIFDPNEEDELWMNQLDWKLLRWKLYENCGVHTLFMDGTPMKINMLVEKKYPLIKELIEKMLNLLLEAEEESTIAFELIKFIKSLLEE